MFILLKIGWTALAGIAIAVLILILVAVGVIRKKYPEKKRKPLKKHIKFCRALATVSCSS
jgi:amino acid transporter